MISVNGSHMRRNSPGITLIMKKYYLHNGPHLAPSCPPPRPLSKWRGESLAPVGEIFILPGASSTSGGAIFKSAARIINAA